MDQNRKAVTCFTPSDRSVWEDLQMAICQANEDEATSEDHHTERRAQIAWDRVLQNRGAIDAPADWYESYYG